MHAYTCTYTCKYVKSLQTLKLPSGSNDYYYLCLCFLMFYGVFICRHPIGCVETKSQQEVVNYDVINFLGSLPRCRACAGRSMTRCSNASKSLFSTKTLNLLNCRTKDKIFCTIPLSG